MALLFRLLLAVVVLVVLAALFDEADSFIEAVLPVVVAGLAALLFRDRARLAALTDRVASLEQGAAVEALAEGPPGEAPSEGAGVPSVGGSRPARARRARPPRPAAARRLPTFAWSDLPPPVRRVWDFAVGGNVMARVGLLVLFVGLGLAVRYFASTGLQLGLMALVGAAMVGLGWRLRGSTPGFGLTLQGGGVAVLYLTIYAAYALYALLPSLVAIGLMAVVAVACGVLAFLQNAPGLAVLGVAGGFAAPVLAGTAEGGHVLLLSYYALLNLGVLGAAWAKGWRSVAVVGFVSTFLTGGLWGGLQYTPALYATVQPFVVVSFAVYLALAVRFAIRSARALTPERALAVDGALVFGLPAATFVLQSGLVEGVVPFGRAWSATALAAVYLVGAVALRRRRGVDLLADAFLAIGLAFATLALPLAFERVVVGAMWVLEGAGLVWVGARQRKAWMRAGGLVLQAAAASVLFAEGVLTPSSAFAAETLTGWIVAVGLGLSAYVLSRPAVDEAAGEGPRAALFDEGAPPADALGPAPRGAAPWAAAERLAGHLLLGFALFWWATTAAVHVLDLAADRHILAALLGAAAASAALFLGLGRGLRWRGLAASAFGLVPVGWVLWLISFATQADPPVGDWRGAAWLAVFAVLGVALRSAQGEVRRTGRPHRLRSWALVHTVWLSAAVLAWALGRSVALATGGAWALAAVGAVLAAALVASTRLPASVASGGERRASAAGLVAAVSGWLVASWWSAGAADPLPTLPVVNPAGVAAVGALLALAVARGVSAGWRAPLAGLLGALGFGALTAEVLRSVHALGGAPWTPEGLYASSEVQAALAVVWTVLALALALWAARQGSRPLWFFGAGVLAVVVAKLFLVDLSQAEALVRVVAFLTVGLLALLIGYRAPLPPVREAPAEDKSLPEAGPEA